MRDYIVFLPNLISQDSLIDPRNVHRESKGIITIKIIEENEKFNLS